MTQMYDQALEPAGLTVNQFGLLAHLYGASLMRTDGFSIGVLADRSDVDATTLNRNLKPLQARGLVRDVADAHDKRVRIIQITDKGRRELRKAFALWQEAQARAAEAMGKNDMTRLNKLLDRTVATLGSAS